MHAQKIQARSCATLRPLIAVLAVAAGASAWADEPSPYYIGASQAFTHDSNVYRIAGGPADSYSSTGLLGGFDQTISRQRIYGSANVNYNKYRSLGTLDNTSYGVNAGWDWATIDTLSGNLNASANQSLATLNNNASQPLAARNILKTEQFGTSVRWGGEGLLNLVGSYAHSRVRYSAPEYLSSQSSADATSVGVNYRLGADVTVGTALRYTRTDSPYALQPTPGNYQPNTANGRNLDLTANWRTTEQTGVNARLSWTRLTNSGLGALDFSGLTGAVSATYAPTAKLTFNAGVSRDAGTYSSLFNYPGAASGTTLQGLSAYSQTTDTYSLGVGYAATAKISLNAGVQYNHARLIDASGNGHADNTRSATLGANWAIARNWLLACNVAHASRTLEGNAGFSYTDNTASCSAQFTLR